MAAKRYVPFVPNNDFSLWGMKTDAAGDYVRFTDYDAALSRIAVLERALRDIAVGLVDSDCAAGERHKYGVCAARLCGIARAALADKAEPTA